MNIEEEVTDFIQGVISKHEAGERNPKELAMAMELRQRLNEYYEEIQDAVHDGRVCFDETVLVEVEGKQVKFQSPDKLAEWLHEHLG